MLSTSIHFPLLLLMILPSRHLLLILLVQLVGASLLTASTGLALSSNKPLTAQPSQPFSRPESVEQHRSKVSLFSLRLLYSE